MDIIDTYYGSDYCITGGLWVGEYKRPDSYFLTCGSRVPYYTEMYYISGSGLTHVLFDGFIFPWMKGVQLNVLQVDMAAVSLIRKPHSHKVDFSPGTILRYFPIFSSAPTGAFMYHIYAAKIMILKLFTNSSTLEMLNILDGPGTLSPVINKQSDFNNGSGDQLESSSFCMTIINVGHRETNGSVIGYLVVERQTNTDCFTVNQNSSQDSWEGYVKMTGSAHYSNVHCVITFAKHDILTDQTFVGQWKVNLIKMAHMGWRQDHCKYGGLLFMRNMKDIVLHFCFRASRKSREFAIHYQGDHLTLIYHHFLGYSLEGSAEISLKNAKGLCTLSLGCV